jgi:hypothetical protein
MAPETRVHRAALIVSLIDGLMIYVRGKDGRADLAGLGEAAHQEILRIATGHPWGTEAAADG